MLQSTPCYIKLTAEWRKELGVGPYEQGLDHKQAILNTFRPQPLLTHTEYAASSEDLAATVMAGLAGEIHVLTSRLEKIGLSGLAAYAGSIERKIVNSLPAATRDAASRALAAADHLHKALDEAPTNLEISPTIESDPRPVDVKIATYTELKRNTLAVVVTTSSEPVHVHLLRGLYEYTVTPPGQMSTEGHQLNLVDNPVDRIFCKGKYGQNDVICSTK